MVRFRQEAGRVGERKLSVSSEGDMRCTVLPLVGLATLVPVAADAWIFFNSRSPDPPAFAWFNAEVRPAYE